MFGIDVEVWLAAAGGLIWIVGFQIREWSRTNGLKRDVADLKERLGTHIATDDGFHAGFSEKLDSAMQEQTRQHGELIREFKAGDRRIYEHVGGVKTDLDRRMDGLEQRIQGVRDDTQQILGFIKATREKRDG